MRLANVRDSNYAIADQAVAKLHQRGVTLLTAPQNLIEFHNTATRPAAVNGLGLSPAVVEAKAVCHVHGVTQVLTFNVSHYARLAAYGPGLIVVSPRDV